MGMKRNTANVDNRLIEKLADGQFHSGQTLADELGISRTAVNKRIGALEALHLDIFRVHGKGYRLAKPLELLNYNKLHQLLATSQVPLYLKRVTTSTHDDLKDIVRETVGSSLTPGTAVVAEMQTAGRGRRGKHWLSPFGANLYASFYWPLEHGLNSALGLSVAVGIKLATLLQTRGLRDVTVKWPNDIYVQGAKVAGVLVELEGQTNGAGHALIGVGLNLDMPQRFLNQIEQSFTDIQQHLDTPVNRHQWAAALVDTTRDALREFEQLGLEPLIPSWRRLDHFYGKPIRVLLGNHVQLGIGQGIDDHGALLVNQENGTKRYFGGEISIRAAE
jgi:BirA family transcriptional regulator, biotin operon repressor / biotin---[acetyl-CoA-carboxylase] ligase